MWKLSPPTLFQVTIPPPEVICDMVEKYRGIWLYTSGYARGNNLLGLNPVVTISENTITSGHRHFPTDDALDTIEQIRRINSQPQDNREAGFPPAFLGYIAYDFKDQLEEDGIYAKSRQGWFPALQFSLFQYYLFYSTGGRQGTLAELNFPFPYTSLPVPDFNTGKNKTERNKNSPVSYYDGCSLARDEFQAAVARTREYIKSGDIYQANITRAIRGRTELTPREIACRLFHSNNIEFGVYARIGDGYVFSTSPERFFKAENGKILSSPIKGTIPKSGILTVDEKSKQTLLSSQKNLAELAMIVDLLRNDLSHVCRPGSVEVKGFPILKELHNVYHLVADICGDLLPEMTSSQILRALFPGGSISGCPKIQACRIIDELEPESRGLYTGSFGYLDFRGNMDFNIMIRSFFLKNSEFLINSGGGITLLSDPVEEYEETVHKIRTIYKAINLEEIWDERYCLTEK